MKRFLVIYFIFCFSFFSFFASGFMDSQDGLQYLSISRRIYYDHTIEMPSADYSDRSNIHFNTIKTKNGKVYAPTGIGYSLAMLPAVAIEDIFLRISGINKIEEFPLQSDWPVLLFASMTNAFFGAIFVVSFYYFLRLLKVKHWQSLLLSFLLSISSSIFVYSKHTFAHMMFVSSMFLGFTFIKKYSLSKNRFHMFLSGLSLGFMLISYNSTYLFIFPAIGIYYLLLNVKKINNILIDFKKCFLDGIFFSLGIVPFYLFNSYVTFLTKVDLGSHQLKNTFELLKPYIVIEGFWGLLFSPGKSIFLYSPILIILIIFWHKLNYKKYKAEIISSIIVFLIYFFFIGTLIGGPDYPLWHGDASFGNRYLLAVVPLFLILISLIYKELSKKIKFLVFYPILFFSFIVQMVGISQPYQIRFAGLENNVKINGRAMTIQEYGNIMPRYSPLFSLTKKFVRKIINLKVLLANEKNQLKFIDGFGYPFGAKGNYWRSIEDYALLKVPENKTISIKVINHQIIPESSFSAILNINTGDITEDYSIAAGSEEIIELNSNTDLFYISKNFEGTSSAVTPKQQSIFVTQAWVNNEYQNLNTIDYPYVSPISKALFDIEYQYWGNKQTDPWSIWHMHSGVYEKTFDFWWLRPFQYWDLPKKFFILMFMTNIYLISYFGYKTFKSNID